MISDSFTGGRAMPGWLKSGLFAALVFAVCWGGAISYWRMTAPTAPTPSTAELALFLLGLPLMLLAAFLFGPKLIASRTAGPSTAPPPAPNQAAETPASLPPLAILAAALRSPHGASPEELAAAIADNKARANLDPELVDDNGFPIMTARSGDASDEALQEEITEWLDHNGWTGLNFSDEQWRALTLATAVTGELAGQAASELVPHEGTAPALQLVPILPAEWGTDQRRAASTWLKHSAVQSGWPAAHITLPEKAPTEADGITPSAVFGRVAQDAVATDAPTVAIVIACASYIGDQTVSRWAASGSLFTSSQAQGAVPGEGAAGLLVTDLRHARSLEGVTYALLHAVEEARRDKSADEVKRADPKLLDELAERVLKRNGAGLSDVALIVADTGHRSSRVLELMGHASASMPQLDAAGDVVRVGLACGSCDAVPFVTALALARHYALERNAPVLGISNEDPYRRVAAMIAPQPARLG